MGTPTKTQNTTEVSTMATLVIETSQRPRNPMKRKLNAVKPATRLPAIRQARNDVASRNTQTGIACRNASKPSSVFATGQRMVRNTGRMFRINQSTPD